MRSKAWGALVWGRVVVGCSDSPVFMDDGGDTTDSAPTDDTGTPMDDGSMMGMDAGDSGMMMQQDTGVKDTGVSDPLAASRTACINEINKLRATEGHAPYAYWHGM